MKEFDYKMRGESSPQGRQRVYFSCHPDDFDLYFNEIAQLVWKDYDCTIWFFQDEVDDEREYTHRLREMQLFIVPITPNFLLRPNRARDFDLQYALDHNIPILPLMQVPGLDALYAKICGDLHYIDKNVCDITTLPYEQKVRKYLSHFLVDDEMLVKIREAFYARIFLSYRKKDRALANQLMELIHNIPFCRDISIWFDEYLVPGEHFNDAIKSALQSSRLFVLCVTENLVNEDNYIQTVEYPKAKELQLPIIPVISSPMTGEQMGMLKEKYKGIPDCIDTADQTQLVRQLSMNFSAMAASDKPDDPMHLYFIGLAYLNGIEVEINHTRAVALIAEAAERNYLPAIEKLAHMYRFGEGVARNREKALELYEKLIAQQHSNRQKLYVALFDTLEFLLDSGELFQHLYAALIKKCTFRILEASAALSLSDLERFQLYSMIAFVNAFDDQVFEKFIEESLAVLPTLLTDDAQTMSAKAFFYSRLALIYYEKHSGKIVYAVNKNSHREQLREKSEMYIRKAIALNRKLFKKDPIKWKSNLTDTLQRFCMMNYVQPFSPDQDIVTVSESTLQLYQNLYDEDPDVYAEKLASFCFSYAEYLSSEPDFVWETEMGIHLTLDTEKNVPDAPEQAIPSNLTISSEYEEYDIKRIRKATALMRYGVILYERSVANDQLACAPALVEAYYCTARLLAYFLSLLEDGEEYDIQQICRRLYADIYCYYQKALSLHLSHMRALAEKHPKIISGKRKPQPNSSPSEQELLNLENAAYTSNPLMECYNFAVKLACNDYTEEAHQLHTGLYNFFREKPLAGDPDLQLANLIIYARNAEDADAALACLHRFDVVGHKQKLRSKTLFHYHYLIADIYLKKSDFSQADHYFAEAYSLKKYAFCDLFAFYHGWAVCRKNLEDPAKAEDLILEGLEAMMGMEPPPTAQWNMLCREYIAILHLLGKASEAAEWLKEILPEE